MTKERIMELFDELKKVDTPTVTNVIATFSTKNEECLGLYNPWNVNWYTDQDIHCIFPEIGPKVGIAVTSIWGLPDPKFNRLGLTDIINEMERIALPTIHVLQQNFPENMRKKNGLVGGNMVNAMKAVGCVGLVSNGPSRDVDEIKDLDFQYLLTGIAAGHGAFSVMAVNVPVSVCSMDVAPGEVIHMDANGACKFPLNRLEEVVSFCKKALASEEVKTKQLQNAKTAADIESIWNGMPAGK